jgi:aminopeptidase N
MKKSLIILATLLLTLYNVLLSQDKFSRASLQCSFKKSNATSIPKLFDSALSLEHSFDVLNYKLDLDIYNCFLSHYPKSFNAQEIICFRVDSTLGNITLNAVNSSLSIDSVKLAGVSFSHSSNLLNITLDRTYNLGDTVFVKIYYRHKDVSDFAFYTGSGMVFTDCEPEGARNWFPCWDKPSDKATLDLTAKVPASVKLGSNGRLSDSTQIADTTYFHWISKDPISTYLIVITGNVGYNLDIVYWHKLSNPNDSIPIRFYWNAGENSANLNNVKTKIIPMTTRYSTLFGEHPFEKNGFATLNSQFTWGGMENQTLTSLCPDCWSENLVSHEFAHQWFGDMVTCGTWADIWLNEGFATYCEALWFEYSSGYNSYKSDIVNDANSYLSSNPGWPIYNPSWAITTPPVNTLFNYAITYAKGACVLHMLRYALGDSMFFSAIKAYATDTTSFKLKNAVTADFLSKINQTTGQDLTWFIDEWIYKPNHPVYQNTYSFTDVGSGNWLVGFKAKQTQTNPAFFTMPVELRIIFSTGPDTLIRVMNTFNNQTFAFRFNRQPVSFQFDPNNNIVLKQGTTLVGSTLSTPVLSYPPNNATTQPLVLSLKWQSLVSTATYRLQVSLSSSFGTTVYDDSTLMDTTHLVGPLTKNNLYYWRVRGKNSAGVSDWSAVWIFTTNNSATNMVVSYNPNWNMVSVPLVVDDFRKNIIFPAAASNAFAYENGYFGKDTLAIGKGYWLKFSSDTLLYLAGNPIDRDTIDVQPGWNMIGSITLPINTISIIQVPPGNVISDYYGYSGAYYKAGVIDPAKGYWVKIAQAGKLILNSSIRKK